MTKIKNRNVFQIEPGTLSLNMLKPLLSKQKFELSISSSAAKKISKAVNTVRKIIENGEIVYGVNTGFGKLANTVIENENLSQLQQNLVLSHCTGVGELVSDEIVRLVAVLKINSLARGHSGVRVEVIQLLLDLINAGYYPCIPSQGSVGASGDLAPLAHLVAPLLGYGYVRKNGELMSGLKGLHALDKEPVELTPLEGLSLLNGTQVSTAFSLKAYFETEQLLVAGIAAGAMSTDALRGSLTPFIKDIHLLRGQVGQLDVSEVIYSLLKDSEIMESHKHCLKVQDPYSVRCQPQVIGACLDQLRHVAKILEIEVNAVTNNPIVLPDKEKMLSGGNFHAEPIAFSADILALILCEIASLSERRVSLMVDSNFSGLPPFLVDNSGLNSGFMIAQVTAAALVSENKSLSHPCSVDSIPTSANQEDHVSMATHAARRLFNMTQNVANVLGIEFIAGAQAFDFLKPLRSSSYLMGLYEEIRRNIPFFGSDRYLADDIKKACDFVQTNDFSVVRSSLIAKKL